MNHRTFEHLTTAVIVGNVALVVYGFIDHSHEALLEHLHAAVLVYFVVELAVRFRWAGYSPRRFFSEPWSIFDTAVVVASLLPDLLGASAMRTVRLARFARFLHLARHLSALRAIELPRSVAVGNRTGRTRSPP